ncbi:hypothetical protein [Nitratifractor sp.]
MIWLYAHTNHKEDLDSLRRMGVLWKILHAAGIEAELLVNDYRAQLAAREMGLPLATTIETMLDIDAVAEFGDRVVIDSTEEAGERMGHFVERFERVLRVLPCGAENRYGERVIDPFTAGQFLLDPELEGSTESRAGRVLIYRDSDPGKELLEHREFFEGLDLDLYWGTYFYVKYEDLLGEFFGTIHESEEYGELLQKAQTVLTAMPQTAFEAAAAGAAVLFLRRPDLPDCLCERMGSYGIPVVELGDRPALEQALKSLRPVPGPIESIPSFWIEALVGG